MPFIYIGSCPADICMRRWGHINQAIIHGREEHEFAHGKKI
jgi:hypothetical protein